MKKTKGSKAKKADKTMNIISKENSEVPAIREMTEEEVENPKPQFVR